ncbi:MAG: SPOR domain-containing protein, partial [Janthinobacterium lividum]
ASRRERDMEEDKPAEREVTLNTGIVLGLFFALALLCAVFFGFGYSMGRKSVPPAIASDGDTTVVADNTAGTSAAAKPAPGQAAAQPVPEYVPPSGAERSAPAAKPSVTPTSAVTTEVKPKPASTVSEPSRAPAPVVRVAPSAPGANPSAVAPAGSTGSGTTYVQIAAVSHQEDADVLLSALRRRGYAVLTRSDAADKLIHVQIGPFGNRKEADEMRKRLAGDGYNAFIK